MKNKLLKTTLLFSLASVSACAALTASIVTNKVKTEAKQENKDATKTNRTSNATKGMTRITFEAKQGMSGVTFSGSTIQAGQIGKPFCSIFHPTATFEERNQDYWIYGKDEDKAGQRVQDLDPITPNMVVYPYFEGDVALKNCLTMVALEHSVVTVNNYGGNEPILYYSTNAYDWTKVTAGESLNVLPNKAIYFKGNNPDGFNQSEDKYTTFSITGSVNLVGNAMTLLDNGKGDLKKIPNPYCFVKLFENSTGVRVISSDFLPATELDTYCYDSMFKGCKNLNVFPTYLVAAETLTEGCYKEMFSECTSLTSISSQLLPNATKLAPYCYQQMFEGCTGITELDSAVLPATTLADGCFTGMFRNCSELTTINNELLTTTSDLKPYCYYGMFANCTKLTDLSSFELKNTKCADYCYYDMFYNCSSMTKAPALPASTLAPHCYDSMFYNCTSLSTSPTLGATTMAIGCYESMFQCAGLTSTPALPAGESSGSELAEGCYKNMFRSCNKLTNQQAKLPAKKLANNCYETMFYASSITTAPVIEADTLADYCCYKMFYNCASLTASPTLGATEAKPWCYREMFGYCTNLTSIGNIGLTTLTGATVALRQMFDYCSSVKISDESGTQFFECPDADHGYEEEIIDNMFQNTKEKIETGYQPTAGVKYYYS